MTKRNKGLRRVPGRHSGMYCKHAFVTVEHPPFPGIRWSLYPLSKQTCILVLRNNLDGPILAELVNGQRTNTNLGLWAAYTRVVSGLIASLFQQNSQHLMRPTLGFEEEIETRDLSS